MALAILSNTLSSQEDTFKSVMLAALKAKLYCVFSENALKSNGKIQDIELRRYFGKQEDDYDYFLMDVHDKAWSETASLREVSGTSFIKQFLFDEIVYDYSLSLLKEYKGHKGIQDEYAQWMVHHTNPDYLLSHH